MTCWSRSGKVGRATKKYTDARGQKYSFLVASERHMCPYSSNYQTMPPSSRICVFLGRFSSSLVSRPSLPTTTALTWQYSSFEELTPSGLYAVMELRQRVFVVEQNCAYLDADGADAVAQHLLGWRNAGGEPTLVAYARLFAPSLKYAEASIGRVVTHPDARRTGAGRELMAEAIRLVEENGWGREIRLAAQMYLEQFYTGFGFHRVTDPYLEDDIWHVDMLRG